tara:strand:+ start:40 stop:468 length:429 start_codon:yes stop_codon:yes gene_type:complete
MKVKVNITYNAARLVKSLPRMMEKVIEGSGHFSAELSRKSIQEERHKKPLSQRTIKSRLEGNHPSGKPFKTRSIKPLIWSGNLYNNIKGTKGGLEMPTYGYYHHIGRDTGKIKRPERPFIELGLSEKAVKQFKRDLEINFRK